MKTFISFGCIGLVLYLFSFKVISSFQIFPLIKQTNSFRTGKGRRLEEYKEDVRHSVSRHIPLSMKLTGFAKKLEMDSENVITGLNEEQRKQELENEVKREGFTENREKIQKGWSRREIVGTISTAALASQASGTIIGLTGKGQRKRQKLVNMVNAAVGNDANDANEDKEEEGKSEGKRKDKDGANLEVRRKHYSPLIPLNEKGYSIIGTSTDMLLIPKITVGMWQVSGKSGFGYSPELDNALTSMGNYISAGFTSFDAADIYGPAETIIGEFRKEKKSLVEEYEKDFVHSIVNKKSRENQAMITHGASNRKANALMKKKEFVEDSNNKIIFTSTPSSNCSSSVSDSVSNSNFNSNSNSNLIINPRDFDRTIVKNAPSSYDFSPTPPPLAFFTKLVPPPVKLTKGQVKTLIAKSLKKMNTDRIDLLQFHWWDYQIPYYLNILDHLHELQQDGAIRHLGMTNFDSKHIAQIVSELPHVHLVSNQIQYSILDQRPKELMTDLCKVNGIALLCYGTLLGGFFNSKWIGKPRPTVESLETVSEKKYLRMIDTWGGWSLFQALLLVLNSIATKYEATIPQIAIRWVIEQEQVATALVGTRLGYKEHITDNTYVFNFHLDQQDYMEIEEVTRKARNLMERIGDCGAEYRT